jgi:predicted O-methyltransferase YrrM
MNLHQALSAVADQLGLDAASLIAYAAEDTVPGYYPDYLVGHIPYAVDGQFLYALVRALRPTRVLESGTNEGGSATHIALALQANGGGQLVTVDIRPDGGQYIPSDLLPYITLVQGTDICAYVDQESAAGFDFIHEDAAHDSGTVFAIYSRLRKLAAPTGCVAVSHDAALGMSPFILSGIRGAGFEEPPVYVYDGSPCGFSVIHYRGETWI